MAAKEDVILDPEHELAFRRPFDETAQSKLRLSNPTDRAMYFKVKTTAPKRYCVRPNAGKVEAKQSLDVTVFLPKADDIGADNKCKDKFLVQCVFSNDENADQEQLWKSAPPGAVKEHKLKCAFLPPVGESGADAAPSPSSQPAPSPQPSSQPQPAAASPSSTAVREDAPAPRQTAASDASKDSAPKSPSVAAPKSELRQRSVPQASQAAPAHAAGGDRLAMAHGSQTDARFTALHLVIAFLLGLLLGRFVL